MRRLVDAVLDAWGRSLRRKPLIVRGARQVGKTWSVLDFGKRSLENVVHVNFERSPGLCPVFDGELDMRRVVSDLEALTGTSIRPGKSLLFLDEIQACPRAMVSLRYFKEQLPKLHVVGAGSLLEFAARDISFPVGRVQFLEMFPMTFAEFLWARGKAKAAEVVLKTPSATGEALHAFLMSEMRAYVQVGGMPEAVSVYASSGSLREAGEVQREIVESYRADFSKYAPLADKSCLRNVMTSVARSVGQQVKYSRLAEGFSNATIHRAFDLLCLARVARRVRSASPAGLPFEAHASQKVFKALFVDVGLMHQVCGIGPEQHLAGGDLLDLFRGAVAEQFVGQELLAAKGSDLFYWARPQRSSSAEVDFLISSQGGIVPVEVKSGAAGRLRSLDLLMREYPNCTSALVFSSSRSHQRTSRGVGFLPLYFAFSASST
ncbi:MAG: ATP-binding protein [Deltaproteobacteria bacterium]|nr:ATP-binding protein [Deltaproteobacteria bacterium]